MIPPPSFCFNSLQVRYKLRPRWCAAEYTSQVSISQVRYKPIKVSLAFRAVATTGFTYRYVTNRQRIHGLLFILKVSLLQVRYKRERSSQEGSGARCSFNSYRYATNPTAIIFYLCNREFQFLIGTLQTRQLFLKAAEDWKSPLIQVRLQTKRNKNNSNQRNHRFTSYRYAVYKPYSNSQRCLRISMFQFLQVRCHQKRLLTGSVSAGVSPYRHATNDGTNNGIFDLNGFQFLIGTLQTSFNFPSLNLCCCVSPIGTLQTYQKSARKMGNCLFPTPYRYATNKTVRL